MGLDLEKTDLAGDKPVTTTKRVELEEFGAGDAALRPSIDRDMELNLAEQQLAAGNSIRLRASSADRCLGNGYRHVAVAGLSDRHARRVVLRDSDASARAAGKFCRRS